MFLTNIGLLPQHNLLCVNFTRLISDKVRKIPLQKTEHIRHLHVLSQVKTRTNNVDAKCKSLNCLNYKNLLNFKSNIYTVPYNNYRTNIFNLQCSNILNHKKIFYYGQRSLSSNLSGEIPHYLKENIMPFDIDDFLNEELEDIVNTKEYDIAEFLNSRLITYEDADSSFSLPCPSCSSTDPTKTADIFVDKGSGFFVCPSCYLDGQWEELMQLIDNKDDSLSEDQLKTFISSLEPLKSDDLYLLKHSPLKCVSLDTLERSKALISQDKTRLIIPILEETNVVGFHSLSLIHQDLQIAKRYVHGKATSHLGNVKKGPSIVVVPSICEVLHLAELKIPAMTVPRKLSKNPFDIPGIKEIIIWMGDTPPIELLQHVRKTNLSCSFVRPSNELTEIYNMKKFEIRHALNSATFTLSHNIKTFADFSDEIYYRLTHKEEVLGVQWCRYMDLNSILLGHRKGELTVITGPTGSGKTTFISEYSLDLCIQGVRTLWGSFEVGVPRLCEVIMQQYCGKELPIDKEKFTELANEFTELPLFFLSFHGQQSVNSVIEAMKEAALVHGVQHIVIDNLQFMLGIPENAKDLWLEQDRAVSSFRRFATNYNCHVSLIAHPKKVDSEVLLMSSISGGARITQEADNVLILQVKNPTNLNSKKVLQVAKNRYGGTLGTMPLKFHKESLTLSPHFNKKSQEKKLITDSNLDKETDESSNDLDEDVTNKFKQKIKHAKLNRPVDWQ